MNQDYINKTQQAVNFLCHLYNDDMEIIGGKEGVDTLISRSEVCQDRYQRQENSEPDKTPKKGGRL